VSPAARPAVPAAGGAAPPRRTSSSQPTIGGEHALPGDGTPAPTGPGATRRRRWWPLAVLVVCLVLVALVAWPVGLVLWADGKIHHTTALSGAAGTPGTTYLIAGSDERGDGVAQDGTVGARTDTILLLHVPAHGPTALISIPRDSYVPIPGHGKNKLNAAYSWGGAPLLVQTVEQLSGLTVDHYVEIGMGGVEGVVNAVGGVNLCYPHDVNDADSGMVWTAGCHDVGGADALAFSRMRKSDPTGDIGRGERQRQVVGAVMDKVKPGSLVFHPSRQVKLIDAGTSVLTVDKSMNIVDIGRLALAFRAANGAGGITGTPPILSMNYRPGGGVGSTVRLDPDKTPTFFAQIRDGKLPAGKVGGVPTS
jgi:LCP family protein required for cell wall assembly